MSGTSDSFIALFVTTETGATDPTDLFVRGTDAIGNSTGSGHIEVNPLPRAPAQIYQRRERPVQAGRR